VGVTGLELSRADFYEKELTFQVSCSYGPGRYDPAYEQRGQDYPLGFVRWTEQRNFEAVLDLMASGRLDVSRLISKRVALDDAPQAYQSLLADRSQLGVLLTYPEAIKTKATVAVPLAAGKGGSVPAPRAVPGSAPVAGMIGAGNFARLVLLPALVQTPARLKTIASRGDPSSALAARKFGFAQATSDYHAILQDPEINVVFIATRHDSHAGLAIEALQAGKHVFVEKPLALSRDELAAIEHAWRAAPDRLLMVGFNRRFAPLAVQAQRLLAGRSQPLSLVYTVNAGAIPADHWTQDLRAGGGRIVGEACHFVDLLRFLAGQPITGVSAVAMGGASDVAVQGETEWSRSDSMVITLQFADGSLGAVNYLANGSKRFPKERVEVFSDGRILVLDNFQRLTGYGWSGFNKRRLLRQDKGHQGEIAAFIDCIASGGPGLISWDEMREVTLATFAAVEAATRPISPLN
jgi:predicted dehydrogenase